MLTVSDDVKNLFLNHYRQTARITMTWPGRTGQRIITEADIMQGGLTIDKYSATGGEINVGTFVAAQLTLKLNNFKGKFNTWDFQNAELFVEIGIKKWDAYHWENAQMNYIPMGVYVVTSPVRSRERIVTIVALDRAVYTDKLPDAALPDTILTLGDLLTHICTTCGITCADGVSSSLPQLSTEIDVSTITERTSYRNMIRWIAFLNSKNAYFDNDGNLAFGFYKILTHYIPRPRDPDLILNKGDIYNVDIDTSTVFRLGGSNYRANDGSTIFNIEWGYNASDQWDEHWWTISAGKLFNDIGAIIQKQLNYDGTYYVPEFSDCQLIENETVPIAWNPPQGGLDELPMYPFRAQIKPMPWLELMDIVRYKSNKNYDIPITHLSFTLNGSTVIACDVDAQLLNQKGTYMEAPSLVI